MDCFIASVVFGLVIGLMSAALIELGVSSNLAHVLAIVIIFAGVWKFRSDRYLVQRWRRKLGL